MHFHNCIVVSFVVGFIFNIRRRILIGVMQGIFRTAIMNTYRFHVCSVYIVTEYADVSTNHAYVARFITSKTIETNRKLKIECRFHR